VDGFRFDLASVMCRDGLGNPIDSPPIVRAIAMDPVLSQVLLGLMSPGPVPPGTSLHANSCHSVVPRAALSHETC
jgi:hypothetical protein